MKHLLFVCMLFCTAAQAQLFVQGAAGMTNKFFSAELQAGYRVKQVLFSAGYTSIQFVSDQPVLLNVRTGVLLRHTVVYGGYVKSMRSTDAKNLNRNTFQVGMQQHFCFYDKGNFYLTAGYTYPNYVSAGVGMTYNLFLE